MPGEAEVGWSVAEIFLNHAGALVQVLHFSFELLELIDPFSKLDKETARNLLPGEIAG